jgi:quercetin dioxygenase-like cupin family protein
MYFSSEKDRSSEKVGGVEGASRKYLSKGEKIQVVQLEMKAGTKIPEHAHPEEQAGYILRGKFEVDIGGEQGVLLEGYFFWIPKNVPHSGFIYEDTVLIDIYSPPR